MEAMKIREEREFLLFKGGVKVSVWMKGKFESEQWKQIKRINDAI